MTKRNAVLSVVFCLILFFSACASETPHTPVNSLPKTLPTCVVFQDGAVCFLKNGELSLAARNVYDPNEGVLSADYAADAAQEKLLFCRDQTLFLAQNGNCETVGANVINWRASIGLETIAFTTSWQEARDDTLGTLFCRHNEILLPLDEGIVRSSIMLSADGSVLYALKPNTYPKTGTRLLQYDTASGEKQEVLSSCSSLFWVSADGETVITAEKSGDETYDYTVYSDRFRKSLTETNGFLPSVTSDGRFLYLLCRYQNGSGDLDRIDLTSLSRKTLARDVAFFSSDAVTDPEKGVVYSVRTSEETYSFYYIRANGTSVRLMRQAPAQAITGIALDSRRETGYLIAPGVLKRDTALYRVTLSDNSVNAVRLMTGDLSDLTYYEETDSALCLKDATQSEGQLVRVSEDVAQVVTACAALDGRALAVASQDDLLLFSDLSEAACGTLKLVSSASQILVAENVPVQEMLAPITCRDFSALYYLTANEDGTFSLFRYADGQTRLLSAHVQGLTALHTAE